MPIPALTSAGLLPEGIHPAALPEVEQRFGQHTARRAELFAKLGQFLTVVRAFQIFKTIFIDGSFVTDKDEPGDIDAVLVLPRAAILRFLGHPNVTQIADGDHVKQTYEVHLFIQPPPHGMVDFFQSLRPDEAIRRGVPPDTRRGILEVAL